MDSANLPPEQLAPNLLLVLAATGATKWPKPHFGDGRCCHDSLLDSHPCALLPCRHGRLDNHLRVHLRILN